MNKKVIRLLALVLVAVSLFSLCSCDFGGEEDEKIKYARAIPQTKNEILERLNLVISDVKTQKPAVSYSLDQDADGADCENEYVDAAFKTVANELTQEEFEQSSEYGQSAKDVFPLMGSENAAKLEPTDIRSAFITDNLHDRYYVIYVTIYPEFNPTQDSGVFGKIFKITDDSEIINNFKSVAQFMTFDSYNANYHIGTIKATIDKETDHLTKLELHRDVAVDTVITGQGTLATVGTVPLTFNYNSTANYSMNWDDPSTSKVES